MECMRGRCKHYKFEVVSDMSGRTIYEHTCWKHVPTDGSVLVLNDLPVCKSGGYEPAIKKKEDPQS